MARTPQLSAILVDTGIIYALADRGDRWHQKSVDFIMENHQRLLVPCTVIPEVCYLLNARLGDMAERAFLQSLFRKEMYLTHLEGNDWIRAGQILEQYSDSHMGIVDASVMAIAERINIQRILTTDRQHFSLFRPRHCQSLTLLP